MPLRQPLLEHFSIDQQLEPAGVRLGVLSGSLISGIFGYFFLRRLLARPEDVRKTQSPPLTRGRRTGIRIGEAHKEAS